MKEGLPKKGDEIARIMAISSPYKCNVPSKYISGHPQKFVRIAGLEPVPFRTRT